MTHGIAIKRDIIAHYIIEARTDLINHPYALVLDIWKMSTKISTKRGGERKTGQQRQEASPNRGLYWPALVGQQSPESGLAYYGAPADKVQERVKRRTRLINIYDNKISLGTCYKRDSKRT